MLELFDLEIFLNVEKRAWLRDDPYLGKSKDLLEEHWCDKNQDVVNKLEARSKDEAGAESLDQCTQNVSLK